MNKYQRLYKEVKYKDIRDLIEKSTSLHSDKLAFKLKKDDKYIDITYKNFKEDVIALETGLIDSGFKDKRIAIISPNRYEWCLTYFATLSIGNIVVPLDKGLPVNEIESLLQRSYADIVVFDKEYVSIMKNLKENNKTKVTEFICMDETEEFNNLSKIIEKGKQIVEKGNIDCQKIEIDPEKMSVIIFTSGTTSISKAVMLSHRNIVENITALNVAEKIYDTDVNLAFLPFHHAFGITGLMFFLSNGACNVFCDGLKYIQKNLVEYKVSVFVCVPLLIEAMYKKIMLEIEKQGKTKTVKIAIKISKALLKIGIDIRRKLFKDIINKLGGNIRFIVSGAAAIDKKVAEAFNDFGILTVQGYGLTETSPVLAAENEKAIRYGSIGLPMYNVEIKIDNPNSEGIGEIIAKGPNVMLGYYENEQATKEVIINGWFHTGDLGKIDEDGYIFITGRKKNVIVLKNGKNVYPEELEIIINNLPYVSESMVYGMPKEDDLVVSAKIVYDKEYMEHFHQGKTIDQLKDIVWKDIKEINKDLATYKYIKNLVLTDEPMEKTTTAKIKRFKEILKE
ncbi:MAG TPA: AMP-binding protein [Clostridia bacterium]|nr:AMP-binding protein [Clostridia bacterium]